MSGPQRPRPADRRRIGLRATLLQSVWNYETLQSVGFAWALLPGLERLYPDRESRARRLASYMDVFNSNPYLATLGLGVALRVEMEVARGAAGAERRLVRLLRALRGTLGALGDGLFWAGVRPALALAAAVAALVAPGPWPALGFLVAFNLVAQLVRAVGVRAGWATGAGIARVLQDPFWARARRTATLVGAAAAGVAVGAGGAWALASGGGGVERWVFSLAFVLLWLAGLRSRSGSRLASPALAFLAVLILLSALSHTLATGVPSR